MKTQILKKSLSATNGYPSRLLSISLENKKNAMCIITENDSYLWQNKKITIDELIEKYFRITENGILRIN